MTDLNKSEQSPKLRIAEAYEATLLKHASLVGNGPIIFAVSGGPDSLAMLVRYSLIVTGSSLYCTAMGILASSWHGALPCPTPLTLRGVFFVRKLFCSYIGQPVVT